VQSANVQALAFGKRAKLRKKAEETRVSSAFIFINRFLRSKKLP
jgi:hypothetical protein